MTIRFEACVETLAQAVAAQAAGADRIELCADLRVGVGPPTSADLRAVRQALRIPIHAMVRPRGGSFVHTPAELDTMFDAIDLARTEGADGVVFGVLRPDHTLDAAALAQLIQRARPLAVTCHRAFDQIPDQSAGLKTLIDLGVERVLTGGGPGTAWDGRDQLRALVQQAAGRIVILAGGSIRQHNWRALVQATGVREIHAAALIDVRAG